MAPWAPQSVVGGRTTVTSASQSGSTVICQRVLLGWFRRLAPVTWPPVSREGVVPQGKVAHLHLLAEAQLEGEGVVPVVGGGRGQEAGRELGRWRRHRLRRRAGQRFRIARIVGEGDADRDGLALLTEGQRVGGADGSVDVRPTGGPLVAVGNPGQPVLVGDLRC